nr:ribosomal protein L7Ae/L30e/S12e/Gadd45 [Tanacetum cinerariifolium]
GLEAGIKLEKDGRSLAQVEAYDPEVENKYVVTVGEFKNVSFSLLEELEALKDSILALIMFALTLKGDADSTPELYDIPAIRGCAERRGLGPSSSSVIDGAATNVKLFSVIGMTGYVAAVYEISLFEGISREENSRVWCPGSGVGRRGHQDHLSASLAHMLYCIVVEEQYNLAYFFLKRIEYARATPTANLPYGIFLTHLFRYVMEPYPHLDNDIYNVVDRVTHLLALKQTRKPQRDRGKSHHSVSSTSAHHNYGSSSHKGNDDDNDGTSWDSTPSPTTYLNSLRPLNYQRYDIPTSFEQDDDFLFEQQTDLLNQTQQIHEEVRGGFKSFGKALRGVLEMKILNDD